MKTNFYINRKSIGLMVSLMVLSSALSFTAQNEVSLDQVRYDAIEKLYLAGNLNKDTSDFEDIAIVQQHKDVLSGQLASGKLNVAGKGVAAIALAGGVASSIMAIGASSILGQSQNKGLTYLDLLKYRMGGTKFGLYNWYKTKDFLYSLSDREFDLVSFGTFYAPFGGMGSLVLAGLSYYLLNKSAKNERLQAEIRRDDAIITELKVIHEE